VVSFLRDADAGAAEMRRTVRPGGVVAACTWAQGGMQMLSAFWSAAADLVDPSAGAAESRMRYRTAEELEALAQRAGLEEVEIRRLTVEAAYEDFDAFWTPLGTAPGPVGAFYARLDEEQREALREECRSRLGDPAGPFTLNAEAWAVRGRAATPART
jgi:hypothetical protein